MKKVVILILTCLLSFSISAKTVITVNKTSYKCAVSFKTGTVKIINGKKYLGFSISDINLSDLYMHKKSLESSVDSQWLNSGERYYLPMYVNNGIGPINIHFTIPERKSDYNRYLSINIDKYLPSFCFKRKKKRIRFILLD